MKNQIAVVTLFLIILATSCNKMSVKPFKGNAHLVLTEMPQKDKDKTSLTEYLFPVDTTGNGCTDLFANTQWYMEGMSLKSMYDSLGNNNKVRGSMIDLEYYPSIDDWVITDIHSEAER